MILLIKALTLLVVLTIHSYALTSSRVVPITDEDTRINSTQEAKIKLHFFGVRGSAPCADSTFCKYGGHTSCVSIHIGDHLLFCDAGTGIQNASSLGFENRLNKTHILLSHVHLDHITGLPFYGPIWAQNHSIDFYAGNLSVYGGVEKTLYTLFAEPFFPKPLNIWPSTKTFTDFIPGDTFYIDDIEIRTYRLNHPNNAIGYRIVYQGKSVCYITDHEHGTDPRYGELEEFVRNTDLLIFDSTYSDDVMSVFAGRGHSTWQQALRIGDAANAKKIGVFHHDPANTDDKMDELQEKAREASDKIIILKQGGEFLI